MNNKTNARVIAFYLPQFHPIKDNNNWWGEGFTEWTNVGKAKPLYKGHYQPKIPADLGYYDLRLAENREKQAIMAKEAGIEGFCYWHYWFGNGKRLLELPFSEVLNTKNPDFPFCLGWANESWQAKIWNSAEKKGRLLIEQLYPGEEDNEKHFYSLLEAFKDNRYIKVDGKPLFMIYKPHYFPEISCFIKQWNKLAIENGITKGFYFVGQIDSMDQYKSLIEKGFNSVTINPNNKIYHLFNKKHKVIRWASKWIRKVKNQPIIISYSKAIKHFVDQNDAIENVIPSLIPNWDHTPRSGIYGAVLHNSTPELFKKHIHDVLKVIKNKPEEKKIVFLKSWNEWGEGNYVEPDLKHGKGYLNALSEELKK